MRDRYGNHHCEWCGDNLERGERFCRNPECLTEALADAKRRGDEHDVHRIKMILANRKLSPARGATPCPHCGAVGGMAA